MSNNAILIGFMGCGKTTVGREVAQMLDTVLFDTDSIIEANLGKSINEVFREKGEEFFRKKEIALCEFFCDNIKNAVIATGGGLPMRYDLRELGSVFYLKAPLEALIERIECDTKSARPLFSRFEMISELYNRRILCYEEQADYTLNALESPDEIAQKIHNYMKGY